MASNVSEDMDISKLKVPDLKKELKSRGLSTSGNKTELVERLQSALKSNKADDAATTGSVDDLDEDLLNDDLDEHLDSSVIQELDSAIEAATPTQRAEKRKLEDDKANKNSAPKKIVLNRNPSVSSETQNGGAATEAVEKEKANENAEKKVIKLSELSVKERLEMRAKKFGVELSSSAKKTARSERFGVNSITSTATGAGAGVKVSANVDVLQKRAERFGAKVSPVLSNLEQQEKLEKRKERFGLTNGTNVPQSEKARQRLERFKQPVN